MDKANSARRIRTEADLLREIIRLRDQRDASWKNVLQRSEEIYDTVTNPAPIIKKTLSELAGDKDVRSDLISIAFRWLAGVFTSRAGRQAENARGSASSFADRIVEWLSKFRNQSSTK